VLPVGPADVVVVLLDVFAVDTVVPRLREQLLEEAGRVTRRSIVSGSWQSMHATG